MILRSVAVFLAAWVGVGPAVQAADRAGDPVSTPSQSIQGEVYPSACAPQQLRALRQAVANGHPRSEQAAWTLIETALCAPAHAATLAYLDAHVANVIERIETDLDAETMRIVTKNRDVVASIATAGRAWDASLDVGRDEMILQYYWNEACIRRLAFGYTKGKWMLRQIRSACD